jgi:lysozyme family protein
MAKFEDAIGLTLQHEGGYVHDVNDPGGETNFGISKRDHPDVNIKDLTVDQAKAIYRDGYWKPWMSEITSQVVANKVFDMGVNMGIGTAVKLLQRVLQVTVDGIFGPGTLAAVNNAGDGLLDPYKQALVEHYQAIAAARPQMNRFLNGWIARANS